MEKQLLTQSRLRAFWSCARRHKLKYLDLISPRERNAELRFGALFHCGLEAWWMAGIPEDRLQIAIEAMRSAQEINDDFADTNPYEFARAQALMEGYDARWGNEPFVCLGAEVEFRCPLINPETGMPSRTFDLGGKLDAIARDTRDGRVYVVEHKTASGDITEGSEYWRRLRMDAQVSTYYLGAKALGHEVAGCLYDVALRPAQRPYQATPADKRKLKADGTLYANQRDRAETPTEFLDRVRLEIAEKPATFYQRGIVVRLDAEVAEFQWDVWQTARLIREAEVAQRHPRNADSCVQYNRTCDYFDICTGAASAEDASLFERGSRPHPELAAPAETVAEENHART